MLQRAPLLVLVLALLVGASGCTAMKKTLQVLKDPSIPVGELKDQPSQVALSLIASPGVNPNAFQQPEQDVAGSSEAPYRVNLSSNDLGSLLGQLKATTDALQDEFQATRGHAAAPASIVVDQVPPEGPTLSYIVDGGDGIGRQVGQYRDGKDEPQPADRPNPEPIAQRASPVAVTVFQLKDDGVFLSADADSLMSKPEKALGKTYLDHDDYVLKPDEFKFIRFHEVNPATRFIAVVAGYQDTDAVTWKAARRIEPTGGRYPLLISLDEHGVTIKGEN